MVMSSRKVVPGTVLSGLHALGAENVIYCCATVGLSMCPALDHGKHIVVELAVMVSQCGVVEHAYDVVEDLVDRDIGVFPCVDYTGGNVLEDRRCNLACGFVEDVGEVVLGEHGMSGVCTMGIGPRFVLVLSGSQPMSSSIMNVERLTTFPLASTTEVLPALSCLETASIIGRMKGARSESTNSVTVSVIFSTKASRPGIFSIVAETSLTTLSRNSKIGYICVATFFGSKLGLMPGIPGPGGPPTDPGGG